MLCLISKPSEDLAHGISEATLNAINAGPDETHFVAALALRIVDWILGLFGLAHHPALVTWTYAAVVLVISLAVGYVAKWIILGAVRNISKHWDSDLYRYLREQFFFTKVCRMIPALVFLILIQFTLVTTRTP